MNESIFDDFGISTVGKLFLAGVAASALGKISNLKIHGTSEQVEVVKAALIATKKFQEELNRPGATAETIMNKLQAKNATSSDFEKKLGVPFPL
jgi:sulfite exporter TauE/SafE